MAVWYAMRPPTGGAVRALEAEVPDLLAAGYAQVGPPWIELSDDEGAWDAPPVYVIAHPDGRQLATTGENFRRYYAPLGFVALREEVGNSMSIAHLYDEDDQEITEANPLPTLEPRGTAAMIAVTTGTSGILAGANAGRLSLVLRNKHATAVLWINAGSQNAAGAGYPLEPGEQFEDGSTGAAWYGAMAGGATLTVYGIAITAP